MIEFSYRGRLRVWIDETLPCCFEGENTLNGQLAPGDFEPSVSKIAVEWKLPHGGMSSYGLLGLHVLSSDASEISLKYVSEAQSSPYLDAMVKPPSDEASIGLPKEFSEAVFSILAKKAVNLRGVRLVVDVAASGSVGSSAAHFENLATILLKLLQVSPDVDRIEVERVLGEGIDEVLSIR